MRSPMMLGENSSVSEDAIASSRVGRARNEHRRPPRNACRQQPSQRDHIVAVEAKPVGQPQPARDAAVASRSPSWSTSRERQTRAPRVLAARDQPASLSGSSPDSSSGSAPRPAPDPCSACRRAAAYGTDAANDSAARRSRAAGLQLVGRQQLVTTRSPCRHRRLPIRPLPPRALRQTAIRIGLVLLT